MNVFGGSQRMSKGARGLRGFPGKDAVNLFNYLPNTISSCLREYDQEASFVLTSINDVDIEAEKVSRWKNKSKCTISSGWEEDLIAEKPSKITEISKFHKLGYALNFPGLYHADGILLFSPNHKFGYFCITFRTNSDAVQTLLTTANIQYDNYQIEVTSQDITIIAYTQVVEKKSTRETECIQHDTKHWTTMYLEWEDHPVNMRAFTYLINNDQRGSFILHKPEPIILNGVFIGDRPPKWKIKPQPFSGQLHAMECYYSNHPIPEMIRNLVISKQMVKGR